MKTSASLHDDKGLVETPRVTIIYGPVQCDHGTPIVQDCPQCVSAARVEA